MLFFHRGNCAKRLFATAFMAGSLLSVACGRQVTISAKGSFPADKKVQSEDAIGNSFFMLDLPAETKKERGLTKAVVEANKVASAR